MQVFTDIYKNNGWRSDESVSGHGSTLEATSAIRGALPVMFDHYGIKTVLDIPCGDFNWWQHIKGIEKVQYVGADIVPELIHENNARYSSGAVSFIYMDITANQLMPMDLILVRDLLGHFSNADVRKALINIKRSGSKYLLATTFPNHETSGDIETGEWRPINLASMWGLPDPIATIDERCTAGGGAFADKSLGLWALRGE